MIVYVSDFDLVASGYMQLSIAVCKGLAARGHKVMALGIGYDGSEHNWPFSIIPVKSEQAMMLVRAMWQNLNAISQAGQVESIDAIIVAMDIPYQARLLQIIKGQQEALNRPYIGIYPIESGPLCYTWAQTLGPMNERLVISRFGLSAMEEAGVDGKFLPLGIDTASWRAPEPNERRALRKALGFSDEQFVVLTVADNQERKNLWAGARTIKKLAETVDAHWALVTRVNSPFGWRMEELAATLDITDRMMLFDRGLSFDRLWTLYAAADAFLLPSKAEGFCALPGTTVWTTRGPTSVQEVLPGANVYTHRGNRGTVTDVTSRTYRGKIVIIRPRLGLEPLRLTPEHPVLIAKKIGRETTEPSWTAAGDVVAGDFLCWPTVLSGQVPSLRLSDEVAVVPVELGTVALAGRNQFGSSFVHPRAKIHQDDVPVGESLMDILGLYIAEGCHTKSGVAFSFDVRETGLHERLAKAMEAVFGIRPRTVEYERHRLTMWYDDSLVGRFLLQHCGARASEKHMPVWALELPADLAWRLLDAMWQGDGSVQTNGQAVARYSTISGELAQQTQFLLLRLGVAASLAREKRGDYGVKIYRNDFPAVPFLRERRLPPAKATKRKSRSARNMRLIPVASIEAIAYVGPVYNLEVEGDESYLTGGGIVHNCMPMIEAMAVGVPVVATDCTAMTEQIYDDYPLNTVARGFPIGIEYRHIDVWGNSIRSWADPESAADHLRTIAAWKQRGDPRLTEIVMRGLAYAADRTWGKAVDVIEEAVLRLRQPAVAPPEPVLPGIVPMTVPRPIPVMPYGIGQQQEDE